MRRGAMDAFAKQIVKMVRSMPDEALLALVRQRLGVVGSKPTVSKPSAGTRGKRRNGSLEGKVHAAVVASPVGLSVSDIAGELGVPKGKVGPVLRRLRDQGHVAMAGTRRFARYGRTEAIAESASQGARK